MKPCTRRNVTSGNRRIRAALLKVVALLSLTAGCAAQSQGSTVSGGADGASTLTIGVDRTAESRVVAQLYGQLLTAAGKKVAFRSGYATPADTVRAVVKGEVSLAPAYQTSTLLALGGGQRAPGDIAASLSMALPPGVTALEPASAQRGDVFVVTSATARRDNLRGLADIGKAGHRLTFGGSPDGDPLLNSATTLTEIQSGYGFAFGAVRTLDATGPATRAALADGSADVVALLGTDPAIERHHWVALADPKNLLPPEHVYTVVSAADADMETRRALALVNRALTTEELTALAATADPAQAARTWLADGSSSREPSRSGSRGEEAGRGQRPKTRRALPDRNRWVVSSSSPSSGRCSSAWTGVIMG